MAAAREQRDAGAHARRGTALDVAVACTSVGNRAYSIAIVVFLYRSTHSASVVGLAAGSRYLAGLLAAALVFLVVERIRPVQLLVVANLAAGLLLVACAAAVAHRAGSATVIALSAAARAVVAAHPPATASLLPDVLGGRDLARAARRQNAIDKLALLVGPAIGGMLLLVVSPAVELVLVSGLFAAATVAVGMVAAGGTPRPHRRGGRVVDIREARTARPADPDRAGDPAATRHEPSADPAIPATAGSHLAWFATFSVMAGFLYGVDTVVFVVLAGSRYHLGQSGYGLLFAGLGAGGIVGATISNRLAVTPATGPLLVGALWLYSIPTVVLPFIGTAAGALGVEAVRGAGALLVDVLVVTGIQRVVLPRRVPIVIAWLTAGVSAAVAAGALLTPALLSGFGLRTTLIATGLVFPAVSLVLLPRLRAVDKVMASHAAGLAPRTAVLASLGLLAGTSRPTLEMLAARLSELTVEEGTDVIREGDDSDEFYVIVSGSAAAIIDRDGAGSETTGRLGPGDWFGEIAALTGAARTATVRATSACTLLCISGEDFREALEQLPPSAALLDSAVARFSLTHPDRQWHDLRARAVT